MRVTARAITEAHMEMMGSRPSLMCTASISASASGGSIGAPSMKGARSSFSCAMVVAPMIVEVAYHRERQNFSASSVSDTPYFFATAAYASVALTALGCARGPAAGQRMWGGETTERFR